MKSKAKRGSKRSTPSNANKKKFKVDDTKLSKIAGGKASSGGNGSLGKLSAN